MNLETGGFLLALLQIIWINILLSGDNAVVIALACRGLPPNLRKWGVILGAGVAVAMRIFFTIIVATLMGLPYLKIIGGLLLFWIAIQLLVENAEDKKIAEAQTIWHAVRTIAIADTVMSLDNVVAIAAAAKGSWPLIIFGLAVSVPMIVFGATLIITILERYPALVWAGAALLGWVAGSLMAADPLLHSTALGLSPDLIESGAGLIGAVLVVTVAHFLRRRHHEDEEDTAISG